MTRSHICQQSAAGDAYTRDFQLVVPVDGVASNKAEDCEAVLALVRPLLKAEAPATPKVDFAKLSDSG